MSSTAESIELRRDRRDRRAPRTRLDPFPRDPVTRWSMRILLMLPVLAIALLDAVTPTIAGTPNQALLEALDSIDWNRGDAEWLAMLYPHVSVILAAANPFGRLGLGIVGAVASGFLLQKVAEIIAQRAIPRSTGVILIIALAANPLFFYFALENMPGFLAVTFFGLALAELVRFVNWGNTESGFRAGILLMLAALSDPTGILYAIVAALASPFLRHGRRHAPGLRAANVLVIIFPTAGAFVTISFLNLAFFGHLWPGSPIVDAIGRIPVTLPLVLADYLTLSGWLLIAPVLSAWLIALIVRRPAAIAVSTIVFLLINLAFLLGAFQPGTAGVVFTVLTLLAIALIPAARTPLTNVLVDLVAALQIAIAWAAAVNRPIVVEWMQSISAAILQLSG